ncbi:MAG: ABC transporter permease [Spirochaetales bacterium]|jgi:peptide/nickel transport system permease protein|nr:ABC transporter permease [Spirochaetales bacterium]
MKNDAKQVVTKTTLKQKISEAPYSLPEASFFGYRYIPAEQQLLHSFLSNKLVLGAFVLLLSLIFCAVFARWIVPVDPIEQTLRARLTPPIWYDNGLSPFYLGTDSLGRDVLSNIIFGLRISMMVGILSVSLSLVIGLTLGLIAGYARGIWESLIMRAVDVQLSLPLIMVAMCFMVIFGQGLYKMIFVLAITGWATYARTVRSMVLSIREKEYIEAAHAMGLGPATIMIKYLLLNSITPILVLTAVQIPHVIILEATLSFLGVGVPVSTPSIGMGIARGYQVLFSGYWWASIFPGLALMLLVGCINVLADWLRDALDPRSREEV